MIRLLASLIIGLLFFLGNISSQAKSYKLIGHVAAVHHHDHHNHSHQETKKNKTQHHHHDAELSSLNLQLVLSSSDSCTEFTIERFELSQTFLSVNQLSLLSFTPSIFRPPIA